MQLTEFARNVLTAEAQGIVEASKHIDKQFEEAVKRIASTKGKIIITGVGKSGVVGKKIAATFSCIGVPSFHLHPTECLDGSLGAIEKQDILVAISNSGESKEIVDLMKLVKSRGVCIITITGKPGSSAAKLSNIVIRNEAPEEADPHNFLPTTSTITALALGDALVLSVAKIKNLSKKDYVQNHPCGWLGKEFSKYCKPNTEGGVK
jgi:arabinose-5-phosphate isomerase